MRRGWVGSNWLFFGELITTNKHTCRFVERQTDENNTETEIQIERGELTTNECVMCKLCLRMPITCFDGWNRNFTRLVFGFSLEIQTSNFNDANVSFSNQTGIFNEKNEEC